jgi:hypothetical protein
MPSLKRGVEPEGSEGLQGATLMMGRPIASQSKRDLLSIRAQLPPASENADLPL